MPIKQRIAKTAAWCLPRKCVLDSLWIRPPLAYWQCKAWCLV